MFKKLSCYEVRSCHYTGLASNYGQSGDVNIHSHPTGDGAFDGKAFGSNANEPSTKAEAIRRSKDPNKTDEADFNRFKMNIIVGKNGKPSGVSRDGLTKIGKRDAFINIFGNNINNRIGGISGKNATKILKNRGGDSGSGGSGSSPRPPDRNKASNPYSTNGR